MAVANRLTNGDLERYYELMRSVRQLHPLMSLLLAVATALGVLSPVRACPCPTSGGERCAATSTSELNCSTPVREAPCERRCCSAGLRADCCCRDRGEASPASSKPVQADCTCVRCDCEVPGDPPLAPTPNIFAQYANSALVSPAFVPRLVELKYRGFNHFNSNRPADVLGVQSRLAC